MASSASHRSDHAFMLNVEVFLGAMRSAAAVGSPHGGALARGSSSPARSVVGSRSLLFEHLALRTADGGWIIRISSARPSSLLREVWVRATARCVVGVALEFRIPPSLHQIASSSLPVAA